VTVNPHPWLATPIIPASSPNASPAVLNNGLIVRFFIKIIQQKAARRRAGQLAFEQTPKNRASISGIGPKMSKPFWRAGFSLS
jgi:hypothetical protein